MRRLLLWWRERRKPPVPPPNPLLVADVLFKVRQAVPAIPFHAVVRCDRIAFGTGVWTKVAPAVRDLDDEGLTLALRVIRFDALLPADAIVATCGTDVVWSGYDA